MSETNGSTSSTSNLSSAGTRSPGQPRLSPTAIAIVVLGGVLVAGGVGAVIGGASKQRTPPPVEISIPIDENLQPIPIDASSLGSPSTDSQVSLGGRGSFGGGRAFASSQGILGQGFAQQATATTRATPTTRPTATPTTRPGATTATTRLTTLTLAPRPRPGTATTLSPTTIARVTRPAPTTTVAETIPSEPEPTIEETIPDFEPVETTVETIPDFEPEPEPEPAPTTTAPRVRSRVTTTTRPAQQAKAHNLGGGLVIVPARGYSIVKRWESGEVVIGNGDSYIQAWTNQDVDTINNRATDFVDYLAENFLPEAFAAVQTEPAVALRPTKRSILSMASTSYQALISGDQGTTAVEGIVFSATRADGLVLSFVATWVEGSYDKAAGPIGEMLGSALANM